MPLADNTLKSIITGNQLFPVFLKLEHLHVLVIGGGNIGLEKISALLNANPDAKITVVAKAVLPAIKAFKETSKQLIIIEKAVEETDLDDKDLIIAATGNRQISEWLRTEASKRKILINVADTPDLCDFYLGSIVKKGDLKIAISTNGKSPTFAKRLKEVFNEALPDDLEECLNNLNALREQLKGDFTNKVKQLNAATAVLIAENEKAANNS
ncbi:MAG: siroheme synthase [Bacteroidetes bacterium]|nr:siroheme synthase [Bacteroidota bacterium]